MAPSLRMRHGIRSVPFAFLGLTLFDNLRIPGMVNTVDGTSGEGLGTRDGMLSRFSLVNTDMCIVRCVV